MPRFFMEFDKAGAEWVIVAYLANDARMIDIVRNGKDPHGTTGALISGAPIDLVLKEHKVVGSHTDPNTIAELRSQLPELQQGNYFLPRIMSIRQAGKKSNHGLNYNMGYKRFALETELDERDAKRIAEMYTTVAYPNIPIWWEGIRNELRRDRTLTNCFGRKRRFLDQWGQELFNEAYSFKPQSTVVDMVNRGMALVYRDTRKFLDPAELLAQVHDSLLYEYECTDWRDAAQAAIAIDEALSPEIQYSGHSFTVKTDMKIGLSWGKMQPLKLSRDVDALALEIQSAWEKVHATRQAA